MLADWWRIFRRSELLGFVWNTTSLDPSQDNIGGLSCCNCLIMQFCCLLFNIGFLFISLFSELFHHDKFVYPYYFMDILITCGWICRIDALIFFKLFVECISKTIRRILEIYMTANFNIETMFRDWLTS